ncbi:MAG: 23S rRNA (pseudouridine(1915)-N(3))-methyltransferase RlmH [Longimicrobiales bacterium]
MKLSVVVIGRADRLLREAIEEYERRAARYWNLEIIEVREERAKGAADERVKAAESERLLQRVPAGAELIAVTRTGDAWSSTRLARHLSQLAVRSSPGAAFAIGGALGLSDEFLRSANRRMRLSTFTLTHEMARLLLAEQLYRTGTIQRGEPYHKGTE